MRNVTLSRTCVLTATMIFILALGNRCEAQAVWSGLTKTFTKVSGTDGTLPENQDSITPNVIIARGSSGGIYNADSEPNFLSGTSPEFTEWATDLVVGDETETIAATNWANLQFTDWLDAYGGAGSQGLNIVGLNAVVHLTLDNIYLDIKFTSWPNGHQFPSGGFSYQRAEPPIVTTGDYNGDHIVDAADYVVWRKTLGQSVPNGTGADGVPDGTINTADYTFWASHFGNAAPGAGAGQAAAVPEPTACGLALAAVASICLRTLLRSRHGVRREIWQFNDFISENAGKLSGHRR